MPWHVAPTIREMEKAREAAGLIKSLDSVGYTVTNTAEGASRPTPHVSWGFFYFAGSNAGAKQTPVR